MTFKKILAILITAAVLFACCAVGFSVSANQAETAKITFDGKEITREVGSTFTYELYLCAEEMLEDVQIYFEYDNSVIDALPFSDSVEDCFDERYAPNLLFPVTNINLDGKIKHNASSVDGFDFAEEKVLFTCNFVVLSAGTTSIEYTVEEMTILGNESSYFTAGKAVVTDGISLEQNIDVSEDIEVTTSATEATEATEATDATNVTEGSDVTEATEATEATETTTDVPEGTTGAVDSTEPSETLPGEDSSDDEATESTDASTPAESDPAETTGVDTTAPTETTEGTEPVIKEGLLGDANLDEKVNIKDVTLIQKYVANILDFDEVQLSLSDTNKDEKVNIKDATAIQKFIAGIIKEF